MLYFVRHCVVIDLKICQDHAAKEKALQTMSSMSSAQIVSAGSAIHNKMSPALVGPLALHASTPVSYPGAVSPDLGEEIPWNVFVSFFFCYRHFSSKEPRALGWDDETQIVKCGLIELITVTEWGFMVKSILREQNERLWSPFDLYSLYWLCHVKPIWLRFSGKFSEMPFWNILFFQEISFGGKIIYFF